MVSIFIHLQRFWGHGDVALSLFVLSFVDAGYLRPGDFCDGLAISSHGDWGMVDLAAGHLWHVYSFFGLENGALMNDFYGS